MKKILYIIMMLTILASAFAGCSSQQTPAANVTAQPATAPAPAAEEIESADGQITLITPYFYSGTIDTAFSDESTAYLEELFQSNGFDVKFDRVYYNLDSNSAYEEYFTYLSQNMHKHDTVAFLSGYKMDTLPVYISLADLSEQVKESAPAYSSYADRNALIANNNSSTIVSSLDSLDNVTSVFVLNSIRAEYTKSLESSEDYFSFINWAQKRNESLRASVIMTFHDDISSRSNILYDIFLPQQGFIPLGSYLGEPYSLCVEAKKPQNIYDTSLLTFFESMLENIEKTANGSRITIKHENSGKKNFSDYSSIVMPLGDMHYYAGITDYNFYLPNYTMEILNPDMFLNATHKNTYIAAAQNTDQTEFLKLLDWIYSDINNYLAVKYGQAGVSYTIDSNSQISLTDAGKEYVNTSPLSNMINQLEYEASVHPVPSNYLTEINTIEYVKGDNFAKQYENYQNLITVNDYIYDASNRFTRRWETTVRALELTTERKVNYEGGKFSYNNIEDLIAEMSK